MKQISVPVVGIVSAVILVLQQYVEVPAGTSYDWKVIGLAVLIAAISVIAKDWQKKGATIFGLVGVALTSVVSVYETVGHINWGQLLLSVVVSVGAAYVKSTQANQPPSP